MKTSADDLVRHLGELRYQLVADPAGPFAGRETMDRWLRAELQLEPLPYSLSAAAVSVRDLALAQVAIEEAHRPALERQRVVQMLSPDERNTLSFHIDFFLDAARRAQNAVIPYLRYAFSTSLPKSFTDLAAGLRKGKYQLPGAVSQVIISYWDSHGLELKHYRDLAQHYVVVASEGRVFLGEDGQFGIYLVLPNNPDVTSPAALKYADPEVYAFPWVLRQFEELLLFVNDLTYRLLDPRKPFNKLLFMGGKPGISLRSQGVVVQQPSELAAAVDAFLSSIYAQQPMPKREPSRGDA